LTRRACSDREWIDTRNTKNASGGAAPQPKVVLVENFFEELKRLVPAN
jgi:hypothetical protein